MKKAKEYIFSIILLLSGCTNVNLSSFNTNNISSGIKDENIILNNEVCIFIGESYSIVTYTDGNYKWLIEDGSIVKYCSNSTFKGLKEGSTLIKVETIDGKYDECKVNVIDKTSINSIEDFYSIDDFKKNFMTLYVYENNNGIIHYYYNINEYNENKDPIYTSVELYFNDENNKEIMSSFGLISPVSLQYGDEVICHYNCQKSEVYSIPPRLEVYNLFFTTENIEINL